MTKNFQKTKVEKEYINKIPDKPFYIKLLQSLYEAKREYEYYDNTSEGLNFGRITKNNNKDEADKIPLIEDDQLMFEVISELKVILQGYNYFQIQDKDLKEIFNHKNNEELNIATTSNKIYSRNPLYFDEKEVDPFYYLYLLKNNEGLLKSKSKVMYHNNLSLNKKLSLEEVNHFINDGEMARMVVLVERDFLNVVKLSKQYPNNIFITTLNRQAALKKLEPKLNKYLENRELTNIIFISNEITIDQKIDDLTKDQMELAIKLTDKYYQRESDKKEIIKNIEPHKLNIISDSDIKTKILENTENFKNWKNHYVRELKHPSFKNKSKSKKILR